MRTIFIALGVGITFATGVTFAAWATSTWHGTGWITDGGTISAQKVAENFEYLKAQSLPTDCTEGQVAVYSSGAWVCGDAGGAPTGPVDLVGGVHTSEDCEALGGNIENTIDGYVCRLIAASCPAGWSQHNDWSETSSRRCQGCSPCTTGSHTFSDTAQEWCRYYKMLPGGYSCADSAGCRATITEIGCK